MEGVEFSRQVKVYRNLASERGGQQILLEIVVADAYSTLATVPNLYRHCEHLSTHDHLVARPDEHPRSATKEDIMTFLEWALDTYTRLRKRSSVHAYKRILFQVYRKSVGHDFDRLANEEVNDYINGYLTVKYDLDTSVKEKPVMNVDDVYLVMHHHWVHDISVFPDERQRIQLALLILLQAYTATRPRVLVYKKINQSRIRDHYFQLEDEITEPTKWEPEVDDFKTISYRDINLFLLKGTDNTRDLPCMEVTLRFTKGWERRENPKTFLFYEVDTLLFDAIILVLALALFDDAFEANIRSVQDFYRIRVPPPRRSIEFQWKAELLNRPVFRQPVYRE